MSQDVDAEEAQEAPPPGGNGAAPAVRSCNLASP
jgi:hypothetical protein